MWVCFPPPCCWRLSSLVWGCRILRIRPEWGGVPHWRTIWGESACDDVLFVDFWLVIRFGVLFLDECNWVTWCALWVNFSSSEILRMYLPEFMEVRLRILLLIWNICIDLDLTNQQINFGFSKAKLMVLEKVKEGSSLVKQSK